MTSWGCMEFPSWAVPSQVYLPAVSWEKYIFWMLSLRMRARKVLLSRSRISAALFLPLIFHWFCSSTRRITYGALRTQPVPQRLLKLAEVR